MKNRIWLMVGVIINMMAFIGWLHRFSDLSDLNLLVNFMFAIVATVPGAIVGSIVGNYFQKRKAKNSI